MQILQTKGFTLIEVLAVIIIMGVVIAITGRSMNFSIKEELFVISLLNDVRNEAIYTGKTHEVYFHTDSSFKVYVEDELIRERELDKVIEGGKVIYYPDGRSSGTRIRINEQLYRIDPVTGKVVEEVE